MDSAINFILYGLILFSVLFLALPWINNISRHKVKNKKKLDLKNTLEKEKKKRRPLFLHLERVLSVSLKGYSDNSLFSFLFLSGILFVVSLALFYLYIGINPVSFLISVLVLFSPYLYLRVRLSNLRTTASYEGEKMVVELLNQYKICGLNIVEAIDKSIPYLKKYPLSQRALFRLSIAIKNSKNEEDLQEAINRFVFSTDTEWATLLGINFFIAIKDGGEIVASLEDILKEMKLLKESIELEKRSNNETFVLIKFLIPGAYIGSIFVANNFFDFPVDRFLAYQLTTVEGLYVFVAILVLGLINFSAWLVLRKPKFDF